MALARNLILLLMAAATPALAQTPAAAPTKPAPTAAKPATGPAAAPPVVTKPSATMIAPAANAPITNSPGATPKADDWPKGAPQTEYEFTAWCYGVLRTHMELYERVKPELVAISKRWKTEEEDAKSYSDQLAAGRVLLTGFSRAIELAEKASPRPINAQGAAAVEQGRKMWAAIETVDKSNQAYSWMNWELPEKCPRVAAALENKALLASPALKANVAAPKTDSKPAEKTIAAASPKAADPIGQLVSDSSRKDAPPAAGPLQAAAVSTSPKKDEPPAKPVETKPAAPAPVPAATPPRLRPGRF